MYAQQWPFQNSTLPEKERINNLISLMNTNEKISCLSTFIAVPRLGVKGTHTSEGLHGLAYSGPANWAVKGSKASPTTTFPQSIGLAEMWDPDLREELPTRKQLNAGTWPRMKNSERQDS